MVVSSNSNGWIFGSRSNQAWSDRNCQSIVDYRHHTHFQQFDLSLFYKMRIVNTTTTNRFRWFAYRNCFRHLRNCRTQIRGIVTWAELKWVVLTFVISSQSTYPQIPAEGLTQFNFINTLPCPLNISYAHASHPEKQWIELGPKSFIFEKDINSKPIQVHAKLLDSLCGNVDFSATSEWTGTIEGASTKVILMIIIPYVVVSIEVCLIQGIFCGYHWPRR